MVIRNCLPKKTQDFIPDRKHDMQAAVQQFLNSLRVERNASPLTIKSYLDDLSHLQEFLQERTGRLPEPAEVEVGILRQYVAWLHECGYARTTTARRLACLRSFFRYCCRESICESNPAKPLHSANRPQAAPFSDNRTDRATAHSPSRQHSGRTSGQSHSGDDVLGRSPRFGTGCGTNLGDWDRSAGILRVLGKESESVFRPSEVMPRRLWINGWRCGSRTRGRMKSSVRRCF